MGAFVKALELGFGLEYDLRDSMGELVISHDVPNGSVLPFLEFLKYYSNNKFDSMMAINIKSDGLCILLDKILTEFDVKSHQYFVFDMSIPDMLHYLNNRMEVYSRRSEFEKDVEYPISPSGVWVDQLHGEFRQVAATSSLLQMKKSVCFVSPELHKRAHLPVWKDILDSKFNENPRFSICTDYPIQAAQFFGGDH